MKLRALIGIVLVMAVFLVAFTGCVSAEDVAKQMDVRVQAQVQSQVDLLKQSMRIELKSELKAELEALVVRKIETGVAEVLAKMDAIQADYQKVPETTAQFKRDISNELASVLAGIAKIEADYQKLLEVFFAIADSYRQQ